MVSGVHSVGLLHGLGQIVFLQTLPAPGAGGDQDGVVGDGAVVTFACAMERKHFGYTATQACAKLLAQWASHAGHAAGLMRWSSL